MTLPLNVHVPNSGEYFEPLHYSSKLCGFIYYSCLEVFASTLSRIPIFWTNTLTICRIEVNQLKLLVFLTICGSKSNIRFENVRILKINIRYSLRGQIPTIQPRYLRSVLRLDDKSRSGTLLRRNLARTYPQQLDTYLIKFVCHYSRSDNGSFSCFGVELKTWLGAGFSNWFI